MLRWSTRFDSVEERAEQAQDELQEAKIDGVATLSLVGVAALGSDVDGETTSARSEA